MYCTSSVADFTTWHNLCCQQDHVFILSFTLTYPTLQTYGFSLSQSLCSCCLLTTWKCVPLVNLFNSLLWAEQNGLPPTPNTLQLGGVSNCWTAWNMKWNGGMENGTERVVYAIIANLCNWQCSIAIYYVSRLEAVQTSPVLQACFLVWWCHNMTIGLP